MLNYIGPNEGIRDGAEEGTDTDKTARSYSTGDGRIVVGRYYPDRNERYSSVQVDELIYFNAALRNDDVQLIYNSA